MGKRECFLKANKTPMCERKSKNRNLKKKENLGSKLAKELGQL